jgi:hypothetical protein
MTPLQPRRLLSLVFAGLTVATTTSEMNEPQKISCETCRDLLFNVDPEYLHSEGRQAVEAHLAGCPDCQRESQRAKAKWASEGRKGCVGAIVFCLLGGASLLYGSWCLADEIMFNMQAESVWGVVEDHRPAPRAGPLGAGGFFDGRAAVRFQVGNKTVHTVVGHPWYHHPSQGEGVLLHFLPDDPEQARIPGGRLYVAPALFIGFGLFVASVIVTMAIGRRKGPKP